MHRYIDCNNQPGKTNTNVKRPVQDSRDNVCLVGKVNLIKGFAIAINGKLGKDKEIGPKFKNYNKK